jgi:hypothetical protein
LYPGQFELPSQDPESRMIVRYTTGCSCGQETAHDFKFIARAGGPGPPVLVFEILDGLRILRHLVDLSLAIDVDQVAAGPRRTGQRESALLVYLSRTRTTGSKSSDLCTALLRTCRIYPPSWWAGDKMVDLVALLAAAPLHYAVDVELLVTVSSPPC